MGYRTGSALREGRLVIPVKTSSLRTVGKKAAVVEILEMKAQLRNKVNARDTLNLEILHLHEKIRAVHKRYLTVVLAEKRKKHSSSGSDTQTATVRIVGSIEPIPEVALSSVFFPTGYPTEREPDGGLLQSQQEVLARTATAFKAYLEYDPDARLTIVGNTDERDSKARNQPLSQRRADRVKQYLTTLGIPESKIETVAQGKEHPLDAATVKSLHEQNPNKSAKSLGSFQDLVWAYNRRVDLVLQPKGTQSTQFYPDTVPEAKLLFKSGWPEGGDIVTLAAEKVHVPTNSNSEDNQK